MRYLTAGESHGTALTAIIEGLPSGVRLDEAEINRQLARRQGGYGRGARMKIEKDVAVFTAGVRGGYTLGSPICFTIPNRDSGNWTDVMSPFGENSDRRVVTKVRPGHADLSGCIKYGFTDARNVLERASARETAARVGVGAVCRAVLEAVGIEIGSHVLEIGSVKADQSAAYTARELYGADENDVRCMDGKAAALMREQIDKAKASGDTLGGKVEVVVSGLPVGIGSYVHSDRRLDAAIAFAVMSVQSVKSVRIGRGEGITLGSEFGDCIYPDGNGGYTRGSNHGGGIEGGVSNGEDIVVRADLKPIPTLMCGLDSIDLKSGEACKAETERSDVCAVPAGAVVIENVLACVITEKLLEVTGGDTIDEVRAAVKRLRRKGGVLPCGGGDNA